MKKLKTRLHILIVGMLMMGFSSCMENPLTTGESLPPDILSVGNNPGSDSTAMGTETLRTAPGGFTDTPDFDRLPNPTVTFKEFIPTYSLWDESKCLTWRIEWPVYNSGTDPDVIPTVFTRGNGSLNSFKFLNNSDPSNTILSSVSLYYDQSLEGTINMWQELNHVPIGGVGMENFKFAKVNQSVKNIKHWVEDRPSNFKSKMPDVSHYKVSYNAGDFFLYSILGKNLYGGIRIVSVNPRIIEVYLAVPNI